MNSENFKIVSVSSRMVQVEVIDPTLFENQFSLGSYLKIPFNLEPDKYAVGIIINYKIKSTDSVVADTAHYDPSFVLDLELVGTMDCSVPTIKFIRGGHGIPLPPSNGIELLTSSELESIFRTDITKDQAFTFCTSVVNSSIRVPVEGNKFFNKHFAVLGSTGSGKSNTVAKILQLAQASKNGEYDGLNNSHIFVFDIHGEYSLAFSGCSKIDISNLVLPYWMLNSEELQELFLDTESNDHNQRLVFKQSVVESKKNNLRRQSGESDTEFESRKEKIHFDSPSHFKISEVLDFAEFKNSEVIDTGEVYGSGARKGMPKTIQGSLYGKLTNYVSRLSNKVNDKRLHFLLGDNSFDISFEDALRQFIGYKRTEEANIIVLDLGGIPFEVLNITVSLISRILFDFGYFLKRNSQVDDETPILMVYEEAHKYAPRSELNKYKASKQSIERIAKEGRKYGVTLGIVSQRPSEISETIFSQCNNFIAMRLTNPDDQNYVKRLLPDSLGNLTDSLPSLKCGEAILMGESIHMPTLVKIDECDEKPKSNNIDYFDIWKNSWVDIEFDSLIKKWKGEK